MKSVCVLLNRKDFSVLGLSRKEPISNGARGRPEIDVSYKRLFFTASTLHDGGHPLPVGAGKFAHNFIGALWAQMKIDRGEQGNQDQQSAGKGQPALDHFSCERVFYRHRSFSAARSRMARQSSLLPAPVFAE